MVYYIENEQIEAEEVIQKFKDDLKKFVDVEEMTINERKLGIALIDIFENYDQIISGNETNKFNKNVILMTLRENTNLSTKEIRSSIKKYKKLYTVLLNKMLQ
jgi:hypothetical protein